MSHRPDAMPPADGGATPSDRLITLPFLSVTATAAVFFVYIGMTVVLVPRFIENELGAGEFGVGLGIATFAGAAVVARPFLGRLTERFGRRAVMMWGALLAASSGLALSQATVLWQVLALRSLMGLGEAAVFVAAATLIADLSPPHRRAEAASYFSVAVYGGIGIGPSIGEWIAGDDQYSKAFVVASLIAATAAVTVFGVPRRVDRAVEPAPSAAKAPLFHRAALWPGVVLACGIGGFSVFGAFIPEYSRTVGLAGSAGLFVVYSVVSISLRVVAAKLPERLGEQRMVSFALVMLAAGLALLAAVGRPWALWVGAGVVGVGMAFLYPSLMANVVNRVDDHERASALSSFTMFFEIGTIVGGLALGAVGQVFSKQAGFLGGAVVALCGLIVLWRNVVASDEVEPVVAPISGAAIVAGN